MAWKGIKLEKEDIETTPYGHNFAIKYDGNNHIIFSPEALEELIKDWNEYKAFKKDVSGPRVDTSKDIKGK